MSPMRARLATCFVLAALAAALGVAAAPVAVPTASWLVDHVRVLSAPDMDGRASGTPGAERAAHHIAAVLRAAGLQPRGDAGGYLQRFTVPTSIALGPSTRLDVDAGAPRPLALGREWTPLAVSADGVEEGAVVFAGHGITAPDLGWDDYAGLDVRGRLVLVLTGDPRPEDPASPFRRPDAYHYSERSHKVINAREHGARGILLAARPGARDELPPLAGLSQPSGILAGFVTRAVADALLAPGGRSLDAVAAAIDAAFAPQSFPLGVRARLAVALERRRGPTANVVAAIPGTDPRLRDEAVVVGAHYDHLGRGGEGSLAPDGLGTVHPGADDNASGTAALLALARAFAAAGGAPRTLIFAAFAGEEMGLLGSSHYARQPAHPLARTVLMVNLDMVGRLGERALHVGGVDSGAGLREVVTAARGPLRLELRGDPFGPSDHTVFYSAGVPVLFLFTGPHADYHRPGDTWDKIDGAGLAAVTAFAARVVAAVAGAPAPPAWRRVAAPPTARRRGGYGPYFGVVPEFGEADRPGVRIGGVRPGSPADRAGVRAGDVLVGFAGLAIRTLEDFSFALRGRRPGDAVELTVVRAGAEHRLRAVLEERR